MRFNFGRTPDFKNPQDVSEFLNYLEALFSRIRIDDQIIVGGGTPILKHLSTNATWDPSSLAPGDWISATVALTGAALGDEVVASFNKELQKQELSAYVSAADVVTVILRNGTTNTINMASGILSVSVWQHRWDPAFAYPTATAGTTGGGPGAATSQPYDVGFSLNGAPTSSQRVFITKFARTVVFAAGLAPSAGIARTAATAQTDFDIQRNGVSVGTVRWAAAGTTPTFIMAAQTTFTGGTDILEVFAPASADATLANYGVTLAGTR